jgi:hypothetical protein
MRRAMDSLVGHLRNPTAKFGVEIREVRRPAALRSAQEVSPHVLHSRFHLAFGLGPVRTAQPRRETPVAREVEETAFHIISPRSSVPAQMVRILS